MNKIILLIISFAHTSCAYTNKNESTERIISNLDSSMNCFKDWQRIVNEWKVNGGGIQTSIIQTRKQIQSDSVSVFSQMVKRSWNEQEKKGIFKSSINFGHWDVSNDDYRNATYPYFDSFNKQLPEHCQTYSMLTEIFWQEILNTDSKFNKIFKPKEVGLDIQWESPYAQQWITYWLLVNIHVD